MARQSRYSQNVALPKKYASFRTAEYFATSPPTTTRRGNRRPKGRRVEPRDAARLAGFGEPKLIRFKPFDDWTLKS
ncbi:MAG: hypothetical protein L0Y58_25385 [Verrucomicrobia subdivision 3 bacterium]|nr:hypothetical protein [Limisphaerales bacterium]